MLVSGCFGGPVGVSVLQTLYIVSLDHWFSYVSIQHSDLIFKGWMSIAEGLLDSRSPEDDTIM